MKKVLIVTSVASMVLQFNIDNIRVLQNMGCQVEVACNFYMGNTCPQEEVNKLRSALEKHHVRCHQIPFARDIKKVRQNLKALRKLSLLIKEKRYDMVHCQSPVGGLLGRFACLGKTAKSVYTVHGFHFYKGAPKKNWLLYFPAEWLCSWFTNTLITINREDYAFAAKHMHARRTVYIPGVGVDTEKFHRAGEDALLREQTRRELEIGGDDRMLLSVGELSDRKNHKTVIRAMEMLQDFDGKYSNIKYCIAGIGNLQEGLQAEIAERHLEAKVKLIGYRPDVRSLYAAADLFVFPSLQEGLPMAFMEAAAAGLPGVVSDIRGNRDIINAGITGCCMVLYDDAYAYAKKIQEWADAGQIPRQRGNHKNIKTHFDKGMVREKMSLLYQDVLGIAP